MNIKDFKAGKYIQQYKYKSFLPAKINHPWTWDDTKINVLLEEATRKIGELNAFSLLVPDVDIFIQMHIAKEAQTSSRIEGTKTDMDEALMDKEEIKPEKRDDWQEVQNYIQAMNYGIKQLSRLPLSNRLLREMHKILMTGVRGENKTPGQFRRSQNWVGGSSLSDAIYIPPVHSEVPELMSDLEKFLHNQKIEVPHLIKIAIAHYQFETIHPFLDGNGRIGRVLIAFYFVSKNILIKPSLYLSAFLEKHKTSYYDALARVQENNDMAHWIKFFLNAVIDTSQKSKETFQAIIELKSKVDSKILSLGRKAKTAQQFIYFLYKKPIISSNDVISELGITAKSANALIRDFEKLGILKETTGYQRNRIFEFDEYLALFKK